MSHLVRPSSAPPGSGSHRRSKSLTDYYRGSGLASGQGLGPDVVAAGTRPNLSLSYPHPPPLTRDDSALSYSSSTTTTLSLGNSVTGRGGGGGGSSVVPLSRLRDVLSDAGVQLGNDDAARLEEIVRRDLLTHPSPRPSPGADAIEPLISLDRFCSIVGITSVPHPTQKQTMELADPRYVFRYIT